MSTTGKFLNWDNPGKALITGASSGIGYALAMELANQGANLIVTARRNDRLQKLVSLIEDNGGHAQSLITDVTKESDLQQAVACAHQTYGPIDIFIVLRPMPF